MEENDTISDFSPTKQMVLDSQEKMEDLERRATMKEMADMKDSMHYRAARNEQDANGVIEAKCWKWA
jgi:hypothetical protein